MIKAISIILYFLFFVGLYLAFSENFAVTIQKIQAKIQVEKALKGEKSEAEENTAKESDGKFSFSEYLRTMLTVVNGKSKAEDVIKFYELSIFTCIAAGVFTYFVMTPKVAPLAAIIGLCTPLVYYRGKLQEIRNAASQEGETLATELLNNYKIYHYNMLEAIRNSAETITNDAPNSKRMLIELSYQLNTVSSEEDIKKAVDHFRFGIDTTWAALLATNIELAQIEGIRVTHAMEDLIQSIIKARKTLEESKRQGSEGRRMLKFLVPCIYGITVISAHSVFGMTYAEFFHNQFRTETGSTWFLIVCITYLFSILFSAYINKDKMDI